MGKNPVSFLGKGSTPAETLRLVILIKRNFPNQPLTLLPHFLSLDNGGKAGCTVNTVSQQLILQLVGLARAGGILGN